MLRTLWVQHLGPKARDPAQGILAIAVGLKRLVRFSQALESELGVTISAAALLRLNTLDALVAAVRTGVLPPPATCILLKGGDDRPPLYVVSAGSGLVLELLEVVKRIDTPGCIWGLQLPGLDGEAEPLTSLPEIGRFYAAAIAAQQPDGPYHIIGYSFGGSAAIEAARCLAAAGKPIGLVGLIDSNLDEKNWPMRAWLGHVLKRSLGRVAEARRMAPWQQAKTLARRAVNLGRYMGRSLGQRTSAAAAPGIEQSAYYIGGFEPHFQKVRDCAIVAYQSYWPQRLPLAVTLFRSEQRYSAACDPAAIWRGQVRRLTVVQVSGSHATMIRPPHAEGLAAAIAARIGLETER